MIKKILSAFLVISICSSLINVFAEDIMAEKLSIAVEEWNEKNRGTVYEIKEINQEIKDYIKSLPAGVEISLYKREIRDVTKSASHSGELVKLSDETLPWYQELPVEEKKQAYIERIKMTHGTTFSDGYEISYMDTKYTPLANLLVGGEENIKIANELIMEAYGEDESLFYHSDMFSYAFTDCQPYILWYDYRHLLTQEAQDALYRYIVRMGRKNTGFSPYKTSGERMFNCLHNQGSEGFLQGILYAEIAEDDRMFKRMEDYLDRCLAHLSSTGEIGDVVSPGYGGFTYANFLTAYKYVEDERVKAKLEILLDWYNMQIVNQMHYESNSLAGTWNRAYGGNYYHAPEKQDYRTFLHLATDGRWFAPAEDSNGYAFWPINAATLGMYFPDYAERLLKNRQYPYNVWYTMAVSDDKEKLGQRVGYFNSEKFDVTDKRTYMTEEYTIGARPAAWYQVGMSLQDAVFRATWRRKKDTSEIKHASDIGLMWSMYTYDYDMDVNDNECISQYASYNYPNSWGKEFAMSKENKAIIAAWPGLVGDYTTEAKDSYGKNYYTLPTDNWENMGASIFLTGKSEIKGLWFGDRFIQGELQVMTAEDEEVRIKLIGEGLPARLKGNEKVYIEDFNTYIALQPLNTTDLGREYDIAFIDLGRQLGEKEYIGSNNVKINTNVTAHDTLIITAYNYYGEETTHTLEERSSQRNGFIVEMGEKKEYATVDDFKEHMEETTFESYNMGDIWTVKYQSGEDTIEMNVDTQNMILAQSYIDGEPVTKVSYEYSNEWYKEYNRIVDPQTNITYSEWNKMDFWDFLDYEPFKNSDIIRTDTMVQSTKKEFALNDISVENQSGASCMIIHEPIENEYIFLNFSNKTASFKIKTPDGDINIKNMNFGRVIYRPDEGNELETMIVPRMTLLETDVTVTEKE